MGQSSSAKKHLPELSRKELDELADSLRISESRHVHSLPGFRSQVGVQLPL